MKEVDYTVCGRKIPLHHIRKKLYEEHLSLRILRENPIIHRHFLIWADHASLLNSGTFMLTVRVLYTSKLYYTDEEIKKFKKN